MPSAKRKPAQPRKHPRQARAQGTVEAIVAATARVLAREGARRATTNRIAEVAGVSVGSLYQYFPNKAALIETVRERQAQAFRAHMDPELETLVRLPLRDAVRAVVERLIALHRETLAVHNALAREEEFDRLHEELLTSWLPLVVAYLRTREREIRPTDLELAARIALESVEALTHGTALRQPALLEDPNYAAEVGELLYRYLAR